MVDDGRAGVQSVQEPQSVRRSPRFGLGSALGVSLVVHLLLATLGWWLSAVRAEVRNPDREQAVLRFTFAPDPSDAAADLDTAGPVPQPIEGLRRSPAVPPPAEGTPADADLRPDTREEQPATQSGPGGAGGSVRDESRDDRVPDAPNAEARQRPPLDLGRALRDFGETLDRSRPTSGRGASASTFVPDAGQFPTTGYGMGNLSFETRDFDWSDYARQIYIAIWRAWHNRLLQTVDDFEKWAYANGWFLNHENRIRFVIEHSGQVSGIGVESGSGCDPLDASATQALAEVILPPLPEDFPKRREVVRARFLAEGSIQEMRPGLTRLKRYGLF